MALDTVTLINIIAYSTGPIRLNLLFLKGPAYVIQFDFQGVLIVIKCYTHWGQAGLYSTNTYIYFDMSAAREEFPSPGSVEQPRSQSQTLLPYLGIRLSASL